LIGNASAENGEVRLGVESECVFDKETRRKPLAYAADAVIGDGIYGD